MTWTFRFKCELDHKIVDMLVDGEEIVQHYFTIRDIACLTNKHLIVCDKQKKKEIYSLPYRSIDMQNNENAGHFKLQLSSKYDIAEFDRLLGNEILNN